MIFTQDVIHIYAESLLAVASRTGKTSEIVPQARRMINFFDSHPRLLVFFDVPTITIQEKKKLIDTMLGETSESVLRNLAYSLADRNRASALPEILRAFLDLEEAARGVMRAHVYSAIPLEQAQRQELERALSHHTGREFRVAYQTDPELIGGVFVNYEDTVIDGTLKGLLNRLKSRLDRVSVI